jgi:hypothetical protein
MKNDVEPYTPFSEQLALNYVRSHTEVKPSVVIPRRGLAKMFSRFAERGLFATRDMPKGTFIGEYAGRIITLQDLEDPYIDVAYVVWSRNVDPENPMGIYARTGLAMANHSNTSPNMIIREPFMFYASCNIKAGDELLWEYGPNINYG